VKICYIKEKCKGGGTYQLKLSIIGTEHLLFIVYLYSQICRSHNNAAKTGEARPSPFMLWRIRRARFSRTNTFKHYRFCFSKGNFFLLQHSFFSTIIQKLRFCVYKYVRRIVSTAISSWLSHTHTNKRIRL